jgi:hypothetical protein
LKFYKLAVISLITLLTTFYSLFTAAEHEKALTFLFALCLFYLILFLACFIVRKIGEERWKRSY